MTIRLKFAVLVSRTENKGQVASRTARSLPSIVNAVDFRREIVYALTRLFYYSATKTGRSLNS